MLPTFHQLGLALHDLIEIITIEERLKTAVIEQFG